MMTNNEADEQESDFNCLLAEVVLSIVGLMRYRVAVEPGERVLFVREPENRHDASAIRVENSQGLQVGYLPRRDAAWLAPLVDAGQLCFSGLVPKQAAGSPGKPDARPVKVALTQTDPGLFDLPAPRTPAEMLHPVIEAAFRQAQALRSPELVDALIASLAPLAKQELLPQTRLRLALLSSLAEQLRQDQAIGMQAKFCDALASLQAMPPLACGALTIYPLKWAKSQPPSYLLLQSAIEQGLASVEEISQNGSVPTVRLDNRAQRPLLLPEGQILIGSKQNRTINLTLLVAAGSQFDIPVSCVERGRLRYNSEQFSAAAYAPPNLRADKLSSVHRNRGAHGRAESDQQAVWGCVSAMLSSAGVESPTESLTDALRSPGGTAETPRQPLELPSEAAGVVVARGKRIIGADLFGSPETLAAVWDRLSQAYCFQADGEASVSTPPSPEAPLEFLGQLANHAKICPSTLGLGYEVAIHNENLAGTGVIFEGQLCHLAAFAMSG